MNDPPNALHPEAFDDTVADTQTPPAPAYPNKGIIAAAPPSSPSGQTPPPPPTPPSGPPADGSSGGTPGSRGPARRVMAAAGIIAAVAVVGVVAWVISTAGSSAPSPAAHVAGAKTSSTMSRAAAAGSHTATSTASSSRMGMRHAVGSSTLMKALTPVNTNSYSRGLLPLTKCTAMSPTLVTCTNVTNSVSQTTFRTYPTLRALYRAYTREYRTITGASFKADFNDCTERQDQGEVSWNHDSQHSRAYSVQDLASGMTPPDQAFGRVFCTYSTSYAFYIVWTQNQGNLLAIVTGGPHNATWDWWHKVHHEISFPGAAMTMSGETKR